MRRCASSKASSTSAGSRSTSSPDGRHVERRTKDRRPDQRLAGRDRDRVEPQCNPGLVTNAGPARFEFVHAVVQEVLYARLRGSDRTRLHARAAAVLERRTSGRAVVDIAHHHLHAALGIDPQAAVSAERAAEWSYRTCAYEQAADWYGHASW